jgi:hypothetical protein
LKSNAGFVGFDGTENKRTILALQQVKKAVCNEGDLNVLLRKPHGRVISIVSKFNHKFGMNTFLRDKANKMKPEIARIRVNSGFIDFFEALDLIMVGRPGDEELLYGGTKSEYCNITSSWCGGDRLEIVNEFQRFNRAESSRYSGVEFFSRPEILISPLKLKDLQSTQGG